MRRSWCCVLGLACLLLVGKVSVAQPDEVRTILGRCVIANTQPHAVNTVSAFETMNYFPALGNGNLMVTLSGVPERLTFYLGKTDFWRDKCRDKKWWQSGNIPAGYLNLVLPDMAGATFQQSVDLSRAESETVLTKAERVLGVRSLAPHESDNLLINTIENRGKQPIALRIETCANQFVNRAEPFEVAAGVDEKDPALAWTMRKTHVPADYNDFGSCAFRMWATVVTRLFDTQCQTEIDNAVNYDANDLQVKATQVFTLEPGRSLLVVTKVQSTGIPIDDEPGRSPAGGTGGRQGPDARGRAGADPEASHLVERLLAQVLHPLGRRAGDRADVLWRPVRLGLLHRRGQVPGRVQRVPRQRRGPLGRRLSLELQP